MLRINQLPPELQRQLKYPRATAIERIVNVSLTACYLAATVALLGSILLLLSR
jgi:hypothetical protein